MYKMAAIFLHLSLLISDKISFLRESATELNSMEEKFRGEVSFVRHKNQSTNSVCIMIAGGANRYLLREYIGVPYIRGVFNNKCEWSNKTKTVRDRRNFIF